MQLLWRSACVAAVAAAVMPVGAQTINNGCDKFEAIPLCLAVAQDGYSNDNVHAIGEEFFHKIMRQISPREKKDGHQRLVVPSMIAVYDKNGNVQMHEATGNIDKLVTQIKQHLPGERGDILGFQSAVNQPCVDGMGGDVVVLTFPFTVLEQNNGGGKQRELFGGSELQRHLTTTAIDNIKDEAEMLITRLVDSDDNGKWDACQ